MWVKVLSPLKYNSVDYGTGQAVDLPEETVKHLPPGTVEPVMRQGEAQSEVQSLFRELDNAYRALQNLESHMHFQFIKVFMGEKSFALEKERLRIKIATLKHDLATKWGIRVE